MRLVALALVLAVAGMIAIATDVLLVSYRPTLASLLGSMALIVATMLLMAGAVVDEDVLQRWRARLARRRQPPTNRS